MHSRIFCLIDNNKSEEEKEVLRKSFKDLTEDDLYEQFQSYGADYVNADTELQSDCDWLKECNDCKVYQKEGKYFVEFNLDAVKKAVMERIEEIKEKADELSIDNISSYTLYDLKNLLGDKGGFWLLVDGRWSDYMIDDFLTELYADYRDDREHKLSLVYEIVRTFDYHY